jgi:hypothetical protein
MDGLDGRKRLSIEERAARRDRIERTGQDRFASLLHTLRAGKQVDLRRSPSQGLEWHPIAAKLLRAALVVVALYLIATVAVRFYREGKVDTWAGPTAAVVSGQRLAGCDIANAGYDEAFPRWIRFDGAVFVTTGLSQPTGYGENPSYPATGYTLGNLELLRLAVTPDGKAGRTILVRLSESPVAQLYALRPECQ